MVSNGSVTDPQKPVPLLRCIEGNMVDLNTPHDSNFTSFNTEHQCTFWDALLVPPTPMAAPDPRHPMVRGR